MCWLVNIEVYIHKSIFKRILGVNRRKFVTNSNNKNNRIKVRRNKSSESRKFQKRIK